MKKVILIKISIVYYTKSGNTEKIAKAIHSELEKDGAILKSVNDVDISDLMNSDIVIFGSPVHLKSIPVKMLSIIKKLPKPITWKLAWFYTYGVPDPSYYIAIEKRIQKFVDENGISLLGIFKCLGEHRETDLLEKFSKEAAEKARLESKGHPNDLDITEAKKFAKEILNNYK